MSLLFGRGPGGVERRSISFQDVFGTGKDIALAGSRRFQGLAPLFAAHRRIIDAVASTPLHAFHQAPNGGPPMRLERDPGVISPVVGSSYSWKSQIVASMLYDGNAFGIPTSLQSGWPVGVVWVHPDDVDVDENGLLPEYSYRGRSVDRSEIIHIPWIVPAGKWRAMSPLKAFRTLWETGESAQQSARDWFVGGAIPSGHLKNVARKLTRGQSADAKDVFKAAIEGRDVLVTGADWDYKTIGVPADEQRWLEGLKLTAGQTAAIYGLQPEDVGGEAANSLTYVTQESNERRDAQRIARPWCMRIEEALTLFMPRPDYVRFNLDANVRADLKTRMEAHAIALDIGLETLPEARALEEKAPLTPDEFQQWQLWQQARTRRSTDRPSQTRDQEQEQG